MNDRYGKQFFNLVYVLALKSLKVRYKNSLLGFMWSLLTPLLYLAIFTFVFSRVFPDIKNYPLYALTGLIFWNFFSSAGTQLISSVVEGSGVLKSINIPFIAYPAGYTLAQVFNLFLTFIPFAILMFFFGYSPSPALIAFPLVLILFVIFTFGLGLFICAFNVYFRDVGMLWQALTPALFYATPVAYSGGRVPEAYLWILKLNPLYHFIGAFREVLYYNTFPSLQSWALVGGMSLVMFLLGYFTFKRLEPGFISNF